ncbi:MAG: Hsp20/alpha crystallin family protein [Gammaproteobacteria bacterium]|nr:Hsp20/alpha crystallin family protein [Gammaproteobacteria bacterium]
MSYFDHLNSGFRRAAHSVAEGWQHLWHSASNAVTHFKSNPSNSDLSNSVRWGVLSCEMTDDSEAIQLKLEVPGIDEKHLHVDIQGQLLTISGEREFEHETKDKNYLLQERAYGSFSRQFMLPEKVDSEGAKASYKRGILSLYIPKQVAQESRKIPVQSGH